jgi:hypothetical protein
MWGIRLISELFALGLLVVTRLTRYSNLYGSHPVMYETRYFDKDGKPVSVKTASADGEYTSSSHGVFLRNAQ